MKFNQLIQVKHFSARKRDGLWYTLERVLDDGSVRCVAYVNSRHAEIAGNYDRPVRIRAEIAK